MTHRAPFDLYIASCEKEGGIYQYHISSQEAPQLISSAPMDRPMYMVVAKDKMHILLRQPSQSPDSGLVSYDIAGDGHLENPTEVRSTLGEVACHLAVDGEDIYAVNYISGSVIKMPDKLVTHQGSSIHPTRQTSPHTHFVTTTPDGKYTCVTDLGVDKIFVYHKDMTLASTVDIPAGHGPRHLAFHESGKYVFCANELASTVSVLTYQDGKMELLDTVSALPGDYRGDSAIAAIRCLGNTVYVSNRGHNSVSVLTFEGQRLRLEKILSTRGNYPRDFLVYGDWIIAANELSHEVTFISIPEDRLVDKIDVPSPLCLIVR